MIPPVAMTLSLGDRFGSFEILAPLGQGAMGVVYRARDTRLARDVAIKVLPAAVASDPDRLARLDREAQILASLNHPNIAQIYGLEDAQGVRALVMELVEGPTLEELIARPAGASRGRGAARAISIAEALALARQIAQALDAAHGRGVVHRDLKPSNIKVRADGAVKVLDFGLARALERPVDASSPSAAMSPTMSVHSTQPGMILGTAAYMSPEQAVGKEADHRSDLWAFGVVLLEMLTGRPAFGGETVADTLAAVLKTEPDWTALPPDTPPPVRRLLRRCLEKDRSRRLDSAADARLEIEDALSRSEPEPVPAGPAITRVSARTIAVLVVVSALISALGTWMYLGRSQLDQASAIRFADAPPSTQPLRLNQFAGVIALAPDGRHFVYAARRRDEDLDSGGTGGALMLRSLARLEATTLVPSGRSPFFSPGGDWVGYFDDNEFMLERVPISGGSPVGICRFVGGPRGASWSDDNTIVFATADPATGLWRVSGGGGEPVPLTTPDAAEPERDHLFPSVLPGGRGVLFTIAEPGRPDDATVAVLDLQTGERRHLVRGGSHARYVDTGHLVYAASGTLRAVRFDLEKLQVIGEPLPVVEEVEMTSTGGAQFDVSPSGTLVYVTRDGSSAPPLRSLEWMDRMGRRQPLKAPSRPYAAARLSPDGTRVALQIEGHDNGIWIWDLAREAIRKLTHGPDSHPEWTPDGRHLVFASNREGLPNLYMLAVDGSGPIVRLTSSHTAQWPTAITADGALALGHEYGNTTSFDLFALPLANGAGALPPDGSPAPAQPRGRTLWQDPLAQSLPVIDPDGRFVAYQSNESGRSQIYVRSFPETDRGKWQVTTEGGSRPIWGRHELLFVDASGALVAVPLEKGGGTFAWGTLVSLVEKATEPGAPSLRSFDVAPDGQRFLLLRDAPAATSRTAGSQIVVVLNWGSELRTKVGESRPRELGRSP